VNKQLREEALPSAYRRTAFCLGDLDDVVKFLIAIGQVGRDNIESVRFPWDSRTDIDLWWEANPKSDGLSWGLPNLHALRCTELLRRCKRLRQLHLCFADSVLSMQPGAFMTDPGITGLCTLQGFKRLKSGTSGITRWMSMTLPSA
jgi:hypothetical protein